MATDCISEPSWQNELASEFAQPYFQELLAFVRKERHNHTVFPKEQDIFRCFEQTPLSSLKVVILGQDPYHGENQANGLSFSVHQDTPLPPSLRNIYQELQSDLDIPMSQNGDLSHWAKQGVLLLNSVLSVRASEPNSHTNHGWERFTDVVISLINAKKENIVFILWGAYAKKKASIIDTSRHHALYSPHPSPLSSYRGFFGSKPFSKTNAYLMENGIAPIGWYHF